MGDSPGLSWRCGSIGPVVLYRGTHARRLILAAASSAAHSAGPGARSVEKTNQRNGWENGPPRRPTRSTNVSSGCQTGWKADGTDQGGVRKGQMSCAKIIGRSAGSRRGLRAGNCPERGGMGHPARSLSDRRVRLLPAQRHQRTIDSPLLAGIGGAGARWPVETGL